MDLQNYISTESLYDFVKQCIVEDDLLYSEDPYLHDGDDIYDGVIQYHIEDSDYLYFQLIPLLDDIAEDIFDFIDDECYDVHAEDMRTYYSMVL